ncbi:hypothetical protein HPP92_003684 [Vanilla planifolia]|uniref:RNase H type-1 domain-containing protein n=1 Tax=Vanilla planifolia TaxID=51239 RepID=A0A835SGX5_VANPL|nr:hypothetical protein HPP92_003684 [Vanilla planifolia]
MMDDYAAVGIIFRDTEGKPIKVFGQIICASTPIMAEYYAAILALHLAKKWIQRDIAIWFEVDSLQTATMLSSVMHYSSVPKGSWLVSMVHAFPDYRITHCYREANEAANWIAKFVSTQRVEFIWDWGMPFPIHFEKILLNDYVFKPP